MLVTMLRAAGFPANPVMTMAGSRVEAVPADQFNHCVVAVRRPDGSTTMLDPTWAPFSRDIWSRMEGEQNYVVGSAQGEGLSRIRTFTPEENAITLDGHSRIAADGSLTGEIRLTGIGASDSRIRGILAEAPAGERNRTLAELLSALGPAVEVDGFDTVEPRDFSRDASLAIRYRVPRYASAGDSVLAFVPPVTRFAAHTLRICRLLSFEKPAEERTQDALLWFSQALVAKEVVDLPAGFRWTGGADTVRVERDAGSVRARCEARKGSVAVDIRAVSALRTVPAAAWAGGAEAADSLRAFGSRVRVAGRAR